MISPGLFYCPELFSEAGPVQVFESLRTGGYFLLIFTEL